jgi:predicted component of type VI protein secretion system
MLTRTSAIGALLAVRAAGRSEGGASPPLAALSASIAALLRTRAPHEAEALASRGLGDTILGYGVPDLGAYDPETPRGRAAIGQAVVSAIRRFEPSLGDVSLAQVRQGPGHSLLIELRGTLRGSAQPQAVAIRAQLDRSRSLAAIRCEPLR